MAIKAAIIDGKTGKSAIVDQDNALLVKSIPIPTTASRDDQLPFAQSFTLDGKPDGVSDMNVSGSLADPIEFIVPSGTSGDRYITNISFTITDNVSGNVELRVFGGLSNPLTNGVKIYYETEQGRIPFQQGNALKSNFEFIRLCLGQPPFGTGNDAYKLQAISGSGGGTQHGYFPNMDIRRTFGFQWGIRLRQSEDQKVIIQVNDDLTSVGGFTAFATGFDLTS